MKLKIMKPNEGRLQTAEHILVKILKDKFGAVAGISKFGEDSGLLEVFSQIDLRNIGKRELEKEVNEVIRKNLEVKKYPLSREDASKIVNLNRLPPDVEKITIVNIDGFYVSACIDPHVSNTGEIGRFELQKVERAGKGRYRFTFKVV